MGASLPNRYFNAILILDVTCLTVGNVNYYNNLMIKCGELQSKIFSRGTVKTRVRHMGFFIRNPDVFKASTFSYRPCYFRSS